MLLQSRKCLTTFAGVFVESTFSLLKHVVFMTPTRCYLLINGRVSAMSFPKISKTSGFVVTTSCLGPRWSKECDYKGFYNGELFMAMKQSKIEFSKWRLDLCSSLSLQCIQVSELNNTHNHGGKRLWLRPIYIIGLISFLNAMGISKKQLFFSH